MNEPPLANKIKTALRQHFPVAYEKVRQVRHRAEGAALRRFVKNAPSDMRDVYESVAQASERIHIGVHPAHTHEEILMVLREVLESTAPPSAVVVEAGCYKGGSSAKLSVACEAAGRRLALFDSFQGIPENDEGAQTTITGGSSTFPKGSYAGSLATVKETIQRFGHLEVCDFYPGWFDETMPSFEAEIAVAFIDVDLASSTRTCLKYLYPQLVPGGVIFSQDGHLPRVLEVFNDEVFWRTEVGTPRPRMVGVGTTKLVTIHKD